MRISDGSSDVCSSDLLRPRLIINVPPGSSKSTIVTVLWQAYEWGPLGKRHLRYVTTSFDLVNVKRDTGKTLDVIQSPWFQKLWPEVELKTTGRLSFGNYDTGTRLGAAFKSVRSAARRIGNEWISTCRARGMA